MALNYKLRPATVSDLESLAAIELESFPDPSWTAQDFLRYDCLVVVAETGPEQFQVAGFLVSRENFQGTPSTPPEREILNIAVAQRFRGLGLGTVLLANELKREAEVFLEVRESNTAAIHLYKNAGFNELARRSDYYDNPIESAIVMRRKW